MLVAPKERKKKKDFSFFERDMRPSPAALRYEYFNVDWGSAGLLVHVCVCVCAASDKPLCLCH